MLHSTTIISGNPFSFVLLATDLTKIITMLTTSSVIDDNTKKQIDNFGKIITQSEDFSDLDDENACKAMATYIDFISITYAKYENMNKKKATNVNITGAKLKGTSTIADAHHGDIISFSVPGSFLSEDNPEEALPSEIDEYGHKKLEYTYYNEILGVFALLKKPIIEQKIEREYTEDDYGHIIESKRVQYKIKNFPDARIEYVFNPAAWVDVNKTKIYVALEINSSIIGNIPDNVLNLKNTSKILNILGNDSIYVYHSPFVPLNRAGNLSIELFDEVYSENSYAYDVLKMMEGEVFLKFMIDYTFETTGSDGLPNKAFHVYKYPVEFENTTENIPIYELNQKSIELEETIYSENLTFSTLKDITINESITVSNNSTLILNIGGNLIIGDDVKLNTDDSSLIIINITGSINGDVFEFNPNVILNYDEAPGMPFDHEIPPITDKNYLTNFCQTDYNARYADVPEPQVDISDDQKNNQVDFQAGATLNVIPNPVLNNSKIQYFLPYQTSVSIVFYNINGQKMYSINKGVKNEGVYEENINLSFLNSGTYFVVLKTKNEVLSELIIKHNPSYCCSA